MTLLDFYGLREQPFSPTPDPRFLYPSPSHREIAAALLQGIESGCGFLTLIARPGMGKTSLLFNLLDELKGRARTAFLFQTRCTEREFVQYVAEDLGVANANGNLATLHARLNQLLVQEAEAGRRVVLVIDEAHNLSEPVLEMARMLTNFETPERKLLQIVLAGQPQLATILARPSMAQLLQRITILRQLAPLSAQEVQEFINYRLRVAGHAGDPPFSLDTMLLIAEASRGIPRLVNEICFSSLTRGYATKRRTIDRQMMREVLAGLSLSSLLREMLPKPIRKTRKPLVSVSRLPSLLRNLKLLH